MFLKAKEWTKKRVILLRERGQDDVHFTDDMAKAIYFEDPAGNIVEFIAREETTPNASEEEFTIGHVSGISEIGLSSNQLKVDANQLLSMGIPVRNDEVIHYSSYLTFFGEYTDGVYIILAPVGRRWLFSKKEAIACPILIETDRGTITRKE
ncbi:hypothetical protein JCM19046_5056 [Bacillus sp. JCM 19046]|nr:hypothetical protein JCM19046_5056 [Bacillus sp. JCM 19046]